MIDINELGRTLIKLNWDRRLETKRRLAEIGIEIVSEPPTQTSQEEPPTLQTGQSQNGGPE